MSDDYLDSSVYYKDQYWNDHSQVKAYLSRLVQGSRIGHPKWWIDHFKDCYCKAGPFERALIINCGNGWVERELIDRGIIRSSVGFDFSSVLLTDAISKAGSRKCSYFLSDCNAVKFADNSFDLVVNVAALHHVQFLNRLLCQLLSALKPEGLFVNFDYVGPHRNQYSERHMDAMALANSILPRGFRAMRLIQPHLPTMLAMDPTEAIHSELIFETFERYFSFLERKDLNGGIAYQIMHNNNELFLEGLPVADNSVQFLVEVDEILSKTGNVPTLFSYFVGQPKKTVLEDVGLLHSFASQEEDRESAAMVNGGRYDVL